MTSKIHLLTSAILSLMLAAGTGVALAHDPGEKPAAKAGAAQANGLRKVEAKRVCMVTNQLFEKDQIPVVVANRTYYGCCEGCKQTLASNPSARTAVDPVSGKSVDKAVAVIGARADGSTLYFESETNLKKYSPKPQG
jgi:YHS domain-containing protein